jgi:serine/threonine-protein kinase
MAAPLDHSQGRRRQGIYAFGIASTAVGLLLSLTLRGNALAKHVFQAALAVFFVTNVAASLLVRSARLWRPSFVTVYLVIACLCGLPTLYYFGPFSAATLLFLLVLLLVALHRDRITANVVLVLAIGEHLLVVVPIALGWASDVGIATVVPVSSPQVPILELLVLGLMAGGHALGRWSRSTSATALAELAEAHRIIGDQRQVLREVEGRADNVNRLTTGRWTGQTVGPWQLSSVLGRGAMGEVYDARDEHGQVAAVKVLTSAAEESPSLVERFHRELMVAASLESPHIVKVLDVSKPSALVPYLAMERLEGVDLATILRDRVRLPLNEVVGILEQVARGLDVAHRAGVVHRDLKPHNLFLHKASCWKILDFGVAKTFGSEGTLTQNAIVGTPQYMAPEQTLGKEVTPLSDIYALGAIAYRCLTGRAPHDGRDLGALVYRIVHGAPARPGTLAPISREVESVLAVAMAKDPKQRFPSAREYVESLSAAAQDRPLQLQPPTAAWS